MHTLKLPLKTTEYDEYVLNKRFGLMWKCHNILVKRAARLLNVVNRNKKYMSAKKDIGVLSETIRKLDDSICMINISLANGTAEHPEVAEALHDWLCDEMLRLTSEKNSLSEYTKTFLKEIGLTKTGLESYISVFQKAHKKNISSHIARAEAARVMKGVEKILYSSGETLHYKKKEDIHTISSKSATNGIRFYDKSRGVDYTPKKYQPEHNIGIEYLGLDIAVNWTRRLYKRDYIHQSINHKVSYCMISREMFQSGWRYYVILVLDGPAPEKLSLGKGVMGGDPGTSTFAAASKDTVLLEELAPECVSYNKRLANIQRKIDCSKRIYNPDNYNPDGTIKKGKHKWIITNTCRRNQRMLKVLYRKKSAYIKCEHNNRANRIVKSCGTFINEKMDFSALAKRSSKPAERQEKATPIVQKDGTVKEVHKFKKKKRFGKSVNDRAPAYQCAAIKQRMEKYGGFYEESNTSSMKASQYHHDTDEYIKTQLSERFKIIDGHKVQRDLYSAFITGHSDYFHMHPDRDACLADFDSFLEKHDALIREMIESGVSRPACFGF